MSKIENLLREFGIDIPEVPKPVASYYSSGFKY